MLWEDHAADVEAGAGPPRRASCAPRSRLRGPRVRHRRRRASRWCSTIPRTRSTPRWPRSARSPPRPGRTTCGCGCGWASRPGRAHERDGGYLGPVPNRAARIMAAAHGGQVLVGARTASLLDGAELVDLGEHRLPDLPRAERLFQVSVDGAPSQFPAPRARDAHRGNLPMPTTSLIGRERLARRHRRARPRPPAGDPHRRRWRRQDTARRSRWALVLADEYPDGVWMVELAPLTDAAAVPDAIATALGHHAAGGRLRSSRRWPTRCPGGALLVVLDNCEHVVDAVAETVRELLAPDRDAARARHLPRGHRRRRRATTARAAARRSTAASARRR